MSTIVKDTDVNGYTYIENSPSWKHYCTQFPCTSQMAWPNYRTSVVRQKIGGVHVVVQLWKGRCERFGAKQGNFPGGIGAELGIYKPPVSLPGTPLAWYPYTELPTRVFFSLVNPHNSQTFFQTSRQNTWWLTRWMEPESYDRYTLRHEVPAAGHYVMYYEINGVSYPPWY